MEKINQFLEDTKHIIVVIFTPLAIIAALAFIIKFTMITSGDNELLDAIIAIILDVIYNLWTFHSRIFTVVVLHSCSSEWTQHAIIAFCAAYVTYGLFEVLVCITHDCLCFTRLEILVSIIHNPRFIIIFPVAAIGKIIDNIN
jgi:hypothetical protein